MICIGIDAAANKHDVCICHDTGETFGKVFTIKNNKDDYEKLLGKIKAAKEHFNDDKVTLGIESTGSYSAVIMEYFSKIEWIDVVLINPLMTSMYQQLRKVHYAKTDSIDATGIAAYLANTRNLRTYTPPSYHIRALKDLSRELYTINKNICESINKLKSLLHRCFPEYLDVFNNVTLSASLYILCHFDRLKTFSKKTPEELMKYINKKSDGQMTKAKAEKLIDSIKNSIGTVNDSMATVIILVSERIKLYNESKKKIIEVMEPLVEECAPELLTIPGIGISIASGLIAEIVDIDNFQNADQLLAFAGLDPIVYESGQYKAENTRISKKGSAYLRDSLYLASFCVSMHDPYFNQFYERKIAEGKKFRVVLGHVAKKLCRLIFCLLKNHKNYVCPIEDKK